MPSNYTANYNLSQWDPDDQVRRVDFNADNARIDAALAKKAEHSALESLSRTVAEESGARKALDDLTAQLGNCQVEYFTVSLSPVDGEPPTISFSGEPELFLMLGSSFFIGSRHMTYLRRYYSATSSVTSDSVKVTWNGGDCKLASGFNGTHNVFAFYRKDL